MVLDIVAALGGLIIPPAADFIKKKFIKAEQDTPERTIGSLATTKPEILPEYVAGLSTMLESKIKFFNRDVIGAVSQWVVDLRAAIRPIGVIIAFFILGVMVFVDVSQSVHAEGVRLTCETITSSWFGDRIRLK